MRKIERHKWIFDNEREHRNVNSDTIDEIIEWIHDKERRESLAIKGLKKIFPEREGKMKVGDIVHHKLNTEMDMVVVGLPDYGSGEVSIIDCSWWDCWGHTYKRGTFIKEELLPAESKKAGG